MPQSEIVIIDYGMGNLRSVEKKFDKIGYKALVSSSPAEIDSAKKIVLPGVGNFATGVRKIQESDFWQILNRKVLEEKAPILGICLGMQLMANHSEEGNVCGFGWINAEIKRFNISDSLKFKVPHMGWNSLDMVRECPIFHGLSPDSLFYFVHSYHMNCNDSKVILSTTEYEYSFTSSIQQENIFGVQFHPEKSHDWGEVILRNFAQLK